eukprot:TRINITY_DN23720_c0_g1_i1.p1 TRINITY_DN23720_c0_g1~~TRINITY_DN23720_c0_g1_i1.p1  ORF type:complete len:129 (+),score=13.14 TRINITY_DN23720_c0_g1_i1:142-528(+)
MNRNPAFLINTKNNSRSPVKLTPISFWAATRNKNGNVISVEQDLIKFCYPPSFRCYLIFRDIFKDHVDINIETPQDSHKFLISFHDNPYPGPNASVYQLLGKQMRRVMRMRHSKPFSRSPSPQSKVHL